MPSFIRYPRKNLIRRWLFQLHLCLGVGLALYFAVVCISGAIIVYKIEMEQALHGGLPKVQAGTVRQPWQRLLQTVREAYPGARVTTLYFPEHETDAPYFRLVTNTGRFEGRIYVFMNPCTGAIVGRDIAQDSFLAFVYDLHANLLAGKTGLFLNGLGALFLAAMMMSGVVLWWPGSRIWRSGFRYERRPRWKRKNYDLHKLGGLAAALPLLLISVTGAYFAFPAQYKAIASSDGRWFTTPSASRGGVSQSLDALLACAQAAFPNAAPGLYRFPAKPGDSVSLRMRLPGDWSRFGNQVIHLDPVTGAVLRRDVMTARPVAVRFIDQVGALHFGTFGGHTLRVVWMLMGLIGGGLSVTGVLMWWNRVLSKQFPGGWSGDSRIAMPRARDVGISISNANDRPNTAAKA